MWSASYSDEKVEEVEASLSLAVPLSLIPCILQILPDLRHQLTFGYRCALDLVVRLGINKVYIPQDLYQLTIVDLWYNDRIKLLDDLSEVLGEGA